MGRIVTASGVKPKFLHDRARKPVAQVAGARAIPKALPFRSSGRLTSFRVTKTYGSFTRGDATILRRALPPFRDDRVGSTVGKLDFVGRERGESFGRRRG